MLVCTVARSSCTGAPAASASASTRALAWSSASRARWWSSPCSAAAAKMPFWRIAPPMRRRCRLAAAINSFGPASNDPPGAPRPLLKATATRSKGAASSCSAQAAGDAGVPQPRAVQKGGQAQFARRRADALHLGLRHHHAAGAVVGVLHLDQRGGGEDREVARLDRGAQLVGAEAPALPDLVDLHAGIGRRAARLVPGGMRFAAGHHLVARAASACAAPPGWPSCRWAATAPPACPAARRSAPAAGWCWGLRRTGRRPPARRPSRRASRPWAG